MATRTRTLSRFVLAPATAVAALIGFAAAPAQAAIWSSSDQWGNYTTSELNFTTNGFGVSAS
ncbi:hypothetical protein P8A22_04865 [Streptomyces laculatispora]|uniref:Uncharacterized protein n=1 Tax=Streptomyces laculatispora TaxID=887464 RepID=A0ABY9HXW1_9ACTN|nr:hypothetical protein [Streptomyces laculatispora]WLQ39415.1 hypothetical protein P8A22_04865 [Streptomyces laculatispora]